MPETYKGSVEVVGAYGRTYKFLVSAKTDWLAELDFQDTASGRYLNINEAQRLQLNVIVRYGKRNEKVGTLR